MQTQFDLLPKMGLAAASAVMWFSIGTPLLAAQRATVIQEIGHAVSPPLRNLTAESIGFPVQDDGDDDLPGSKGAGAATGAAFDPVLQKTALSPLVTIPGLNLLGLGVGFVGPGGSATPHGVPPDPNAAVGATQVVETVNLSIAVFDKTTGAVTAGPTFIGSLWKRFNASCADAASLADPIVLYDKLAGRWVMKIGTLTTPYIACLAVSQSSDATGAWYLYAFTQQAEGRYTGQKLTTWPDAYYLNTSITNNSVYEGSSACAVDRSQMLIGQTATMQCIQIAGTGNQLLGMLPCDWDGPTAPPGGTPNYFMIEGPAKSNSLQLYRMHVDFTTPANTTLTGPVDIAVAPYTAAGQVPQFGTTQKLNTNGTGLMHRLSYRNFANATPPYESLIVSHAIVTKKGSQEGVGMRWYEIRSPGSTPVVYQQGTYAPNLSYRWMGSIAMDGFGDMALGYTISTSTGYPSVRYTGRLASDPLGTMEAEATIYDGSGYQEASDRWGDYTSMSVDPADDCTMWYTGQYMAGTGDYEWATRLFSFQFPACRQAAHSGGTDRTDHRFLWSVVAASQAASGAASAFRVEPRSGTGPDKYSSLCRVSQP
ncbi:MAG: hypothetical protein ACLP59_31680 [Bryobacteraceae bacterium]